MKPIEEADEAKQRFNDSKKKRVAAVTESNIIITRIETAASSNKIIWATSHAENPFITISVKTVRITDTEATFKDMKAMQPSGHRGETLVQSDKCASRMTTNAT